MKKSIASLLVAPLLAMLTTFAVASSELKLDAAPDRLNDLPALQNGAKLFVNYCLNCHAASFVRYNQLMQLGLSKEQIEQNLLFTGTKVGDLMTISAKAQDSQVWFGVTPPDLSLVARSRASENGSGPDYLYSFLRGFYRDATTPSGWNNRVFPNTAMPNVLWTLQGERLPRYKEVAAHEGEAGGTVKEFEGYDLISPGQLDEKEFDNQVADLVAFMTWMSEPGQLERKRLGIWVLMYLALLIVVTWRLNAAFWKDVK